MDLTKAPTLEERSAPATAVRHIGTLTAQPFRTFSPHYGTARGDGKDCSGRRSNSSKALPYPPLTDSVTQNRRPQTTHYCYARAGLFVRGGKGFEITSAAVGIDEAPAKNRVAPLGAEVF